MEFQYRTTVLDHVFSSTIFQYSKYDITLNALFVAPQQEYGEEEEEEEEEGEEEEEDEEEAEEGEEEEREQEDK